MKSIDRFIHQSVNRKQLTKRFQPGERINGRRGTKLTEPKTQRQVVLNVMSAKCLCMSREKSTSFREGRSEGEGEHGIDVLFHQDDIRLCEIAFYRESILFKGSNGNIFTNGFDLTPVLLAVAASTDSARDETRRFSKLEF